MAITGDGPRSIAHGGEALRSVRAGPFTVSEVVYGSRLRQAPHRHAQACVTFVLDGSFVEDLVGDRTRCTPLTALVKPPRVLHACRGCLADTRCITLEVPEASIPSFGSVGTMWRRASYADGETLWPLISRMSVELGSADEAGALALEGLCMDLVAELYRLTLRPRGSAEPAWLVEAVELLHTYRGRGIALSELADRVGVHRTHLAREFRRQHGLSVGAFARLLRVQHACELLRLPHLTLAEIAMDSGFYDQSHLTNVFREYVGMTPGVYRERLHRR